MPPSTSSFVRPKLTLGRDARRPASRLSLYTSNNQRFRFPASQQTLPTPFFTTTTNFFTAMSSYVPAALSLIGLCALAGAGVGIGSGVAMFAMQAAEAEAAAPSASTFAAASAKEDGRRAAGRGFAASTAK